MFWDSPQEKQFIQVVNNVLGDDVPGHQHSQA
ncbi:unnamed protein product, partial [marine sediment metagenome]